MAGPRITRFAPSPTGPLHLGHAYAALYAARLARQNGGQFLLRIEDIDQARCRPAYVQGIYDDLAWLGLSWQGPVWHQSTRMNAYAEALDSLNRHGLIYGCACTRGDIRAALSAPQEGVIQGPDGPVYPGLCRDKGLPLAGNTVRLNMEKALVQTGPIHFCDMAIGLHFGRHRFTSQEMIATIGDAVLARRDIGCSYHLAVVVDDGAQHVTDITRGDDLFSATPLQVLLQRLLGLPTPRYHHHRLIRDEAGKRLAKRDDARAIALYRAEGADVRDICAMIGL